jgi:hypothetical protein
MERDDKIKYEEWIKKTIERLRGPIIERAVQIEQLIDIYIAAKFTNSLDSEDEFICLILANMNMQTKLKVFGYLMNKHNKDYTNSNPEFYNDLCISNSRRNAIAHYPAAFDESSVLDFLLFNKFTLAKARHEKQSIPEFEMFERQHISEDDINGLMQMMDRYIADLRILNGYDSAPDENSGQA